MRTTFGIVVREQGTFVRLLDGRWVRLHPGQIIHIDLPGSANLAGDAFEGEVGEGLAKELEYELQQAHARVAERTNG
jgi:hypothetical protein